MDKKDFGGKGRIVHLIILYHPAWEETVIFLVYTYVRQQMKRGGLRLMTCFSFNDEWAMQGVSSALSSVVLALYIVS